MVAELQFRKDFSHGAAERIQDARPVVLGGQAEHEVEQILKEAQTHVPHSPFFPGRPGG
jgi:hypothetical protein